VDEDKLADLFRAAVADPPPASFDERDVAARSGRVTARRRSMLIGAGGLAVVVLAVGVLLGTGVFGHTANGGTVAASAGVAQRPAATSGRGFGNVPLAPPDAGAQVVTPSGTHFPSSTPKQGGGENGGPGPAAGGTHAGCGPTDGQLAVALANELPSVGAAVAAPTALACVPGTRSATYVVHDGMTTGYVTALLVPVDAKSLFSDRAPGATGHTGPAHSGRWTAVVLSQPTQGPPTGPLANQIAGIQKAIAARF
jgi:hypothetical protein